MKFVLILAVLGWATNSGGVTTAEFDTMAACEHAKERAVALVSEVLGGRADGICLPSGTRVP